MNFLAIMSGGTGGKKKMQYVNGAKEYCPWE